MDRAGFAAFGMETSPHGTVAKLAGTRTFAGADDGTLLTLARNAKLVDARSAEQTRAAPGRNPGLLVLLSGNAAVGTPDKVVELPGPRATRGRSADFGLRPATARAGTLASCRSMRLPGGLHGLRRGNRLLPVDRPPIDPRQIGRLL
jgi:hypothetical protein